MSLKVVHRTFAPVIAICLGLGGIFGGAASGSTSHSSSSFAKGMDTIFYDHCESNSVWANRANTQFQAFHSLGANSVAIVIPMYTDSVTSNNIYTKLACGGTFHTPPPALLGQIIQIGHNHGLKVLVRPLLDEANLKALNFLSWRGGIRPTKVSTWFSNYLTSLTPYLKVSQSNHAESFAIATEFSSLAAKSNWPSLISAAKILFKGTLIFTSSWKPKNHATNWSGTSPAVDTYGPVALAQPTWSPAQLLAGWDANLKTLPIPHLSMTRITEVGISAQTGAYQYPGTTQLPIAYFPFNQQVQANWFATACSFAKEHPFQGIYFWGEDLSLNSGALLSAPEPSKLQSLQPMTQTAIRNCFGVGTNPSVSSISPTSGSHKGGATVTIHGSHFVATLNVMFGSTPATSFSVSSDGTIVAKAPAHSNGKVQIQVLTGAGNSGTSSKSSFTYK